MPIEKILVIILVVLAVGGLIWSIISFADTPNSAEVENTPQNYAEFVARELPDKCQTPDGYTDEQWREHMSHHPDRYRECFTPLETSTSPVGGLGKNTADNLTPSVESRSLTGLTSANQESMITYKNISPDELAGMLKDKDFTFIDVHIPEQAHIAGTDKFIPYNEPAARQSELPQNKNAKIVLYCRSGSMSQTASQTLVDMGYTNIYNLAGGIIAWRQKGYPIE
jgi:rhodanese-related sulfurtransferase